MPAKCLCVLRTCRVASALLALSTPLSQNALEARFLTKRPFASVSRSRPGLNIFRTAAKEESTRERASRDFIRATESRSPAAIRRTYPPLVAAIVSRMGDIANVDETVGNRRIMLDAMQTLVASTAGNNSDYELLWRIFEDLQRVFGLQPNLDECAAMLAGIVEHGHLKDAYDWLKALPAAFSLMPGVREWNMVLSGIERHLRSQVNSDSTNATRIRADEANLLQAVYSDMLQANVKPDIVSCNTLLTALAVKVDLIQLRAGLTDMTKRGLAPDAQTYAILLRACVAAGDDKGAHAAALSLQNWPLSEPVSIDAWNSLLLLKHQWPDGAKDVVAMMRARGITPDNSTLTAIIRCDATLVGDLPAAARLIDQAEDLTGVTIDAEALGIVIQRLALLDGHAAFDAAFAIYREAVHGSRALITSNELVFILLRLLARAQEPDLSIAKRLYADLWSAYHNGRARAPALEVYEEMLALCAASTAGAQWAELLLQDMRKLRLALPKAALVKHATEVCKMAPDHASALRLVLAFHELDESLADTELAEAFIEIYLSLPLADQPAPYEQTTTLVQRMRFVRAFLGTRGYSLIFKHYGGVNASGRGDAFAVQRFQTILNLDRFYKPETPVFNELIRAYAGSGAYDAAWQAWESMLVAPQRVLWDEGTIIAVLDLCGAAVGQRILDPRPVWRLARAREAIDPLFRLGKTAWDAWVAALARIGTPRQMDYATDVVTGQMGRREAFREPLEGYELCTRAKPPPEADASTVDLLFRYAHAKGGEDLLLWLHGRLQQQLPELLSEADSLERFEWEEVRRLREQCNWPDYGALNVLF